MMNRNHLGRVLDADVDMNSACVGAIETSPEAAAKYEARWRHDHVATLARELFLATMERTTLPRETRDMEETVMACFWAAQQFENARVALAKTYGEVTGGLPTGRQFEDFLEDFTETRNRIEGVADDEDPNTRL